MLRYSPPNGSTAGRAGPVSSPDRQALCIGMVVLQTMLYEREAAIKFALSLRCPFLRKA